MDLYRPAEDHQQTVNYKKTTRMTGFRWTHFSWAIHQYVAVTIWSEGGFRQRRIPSATYFRPAMDPPLGSPTKYSDVWLPRKCDYRTDTHIWTDRHRTKACLCADMLRMRRKTERLIKKHDCLCQISPKINQDAIYLTKPTGIISNLSMSYFTWKLNKMNAD